MSIFAVLAIGSDITGLAARQDLPSVERGVAIVGNLLLLSALGLAVRWTRAALVTAILAMIASLVAWQLPIGLFAFAVVIFVAALRRDLFVGVTIGIAVVAWLGASVVMRGTANLQSTIRLVLLTVLVAGLVGWILGAEIRRGTAAERRAQALEIEAAEVRTRERQVLARELHDVVAHGLTLISMQAVVMRVTSKPEQREAARGAIERSSRESLEELKRLLQVLRASDVMTDDATVAQQGALEESSRSDVEALVDRLAEDLRAVGHIVHVDCAVGPLAHSVQLAADRVLREATTNIVKHAGKGTTCRITVRDTGRTLVIDVANELRSERPAQLGSTRLGVVGLTERVELLGGSLSAGREGERWHMHALLPLSG